MTNTERDWSSFALLLIDVQQDFWKDEMSDTLVNYEKNVYALLDLCRQEEIDIIHLRANFNPDKSDWMLHYKFLDQIPCIEGTPGADVFECAKGTTGEPVIYKQTFDGFRNPELEQLLKASNKRFLLVAGLVTSVCVLLTSASAAQRGYLVAAVEDCCADQPTAHDHTLQRYPFIFDRVTVERILPNHRDWTEMLNRAAVL